MKIFLGSDHAGFALKEAIKVFLQKKEYDVVDCGAVTFDPLDDYPDFVGKAGLEVERNLGSFGFVFGKSGAGECVVANKIKGIRAVLAVNNENVMLSRLHNDANVLSFGTLFFDVERAKELAKLFLTTEFSNEARHVRRIRKIAELEGEKK